MSGMFLVAGKEVSPYNDHMWGVIRERDGVPNSFLQDADYVGPFKPGGGKGGDLMACTKDGRYIIKELGGGDHECLLSITSSFVKRIKDGQTLLVTIYLHYTDPKEERSFMVMRNIIQHTGPFLGLYDLKGCADDKTMEFNGRKVKTVHKRIWHLHMWCGNCTWSDDRKKYYQGKVDARKVDIMLTAKQKMGITNCLQLDTDWLAENNLMDYSLLVGVKRMSRAEFEADKIAQFVMGSSDELRQPLMHLEGGDVILTYIGIIDFLQTWTFGKKVAMALKVLERNKATIPPPAYAVRFYEHFNQHIKGSAKPLDGKKEAEGTNGKWTEAPSELIGDDACEEMNSYYSCRSTGTMPTKRPSMSGASRSWFSCFRGVF